MKQPKTPLDIYQSHIAHANNIIFIEVLDNIQNQNNNAILQTN